MIKGLRPEKGFRFFSRSITSVVRIERTFSLRSLTRFQLIFIHCNCDVDRVYEQLGYQATCTCSSVMAPGKEVVSNRVVLFNFFKGHGQIKRSPIIVLNYNLIDYLNNSNLFNSYNPGQKVLGHLPFSWNLQLTCNTHLLTRP